MQRISVRKNHNGPFAPFAYLFLLNPYCLFLRELKKMTLHPTYIKLEHDARYDRLRQEAARNQQLLAIQKPRITVKRMVAQHLGNALINAGLKLAGTQATT